MKFIAIICCVLGLMGLLMCAEVMAKSSSNGEGEIACPTDLLMLEGKIEEVLASIANERFKKTMRTMIQASIPSAIQRADGIKDQIIFLGKQIREQDRSQSYAENVARKASNNMREALVACQSEEKGSYCDAVEQYYIGKASNLANHGFLDALKCYQQHGVR